MDEQFEMSKLFHHLYRMGIAAAASIVVTCSMSIAAEVRAEPQTIHYISARAANAAVAAAVKSCSERGYAVSVTVVDQNSNRLAFLRGDAAGSHTADVSWGKAFGAASYAPIYGMEDTAAVGKLKASQPGFQVPDHMVLRGGGVTIKWASEVVGAIGVSGSPGADLDDACARAGSDVIKASFK
jgi:uncharacterized protein GlcG (DUF336 family)